jgi:PqqA peptide cyclase
MTASASLPPPVGHSVPAPIGLLAELTHRCPLQCAYCSNPLDLERQKAELPTAQWIDVLDQAADLGVLQLHLSGGEPTARRDLEHLVAHAAKRQLYSNLITSGYGVTRERLAALAAAGLDHLQISIQDADPANADRIAGVPGAHARKVALAGFARDLDLALTINAPIHRHNVDNLEAIIRFAVSLGARRVEVAHVQYYGWGLVNRAALLPTRQQVLQSIDVVAAARERYKGVVTFDFVAPDYYARRPKPCMGGWARGIINITPSGKVLPCHAAESISSLRFDTVTDRSLRDIWTDSAAFNAYRGTAWMKEPCRSCAFKEADWGGCRCQALALTGDAANADPMCAKSPFHGTIAGLALAESSAAPPPFIYRKPTKVAAPDR